MDRYGVLVVVLSALLLVSTTYAGDNLNTVVFDCPRHGAVKSFGFGKVGDRSVEADSSRTRYLVTEQYDTYAKQGEGYEDIGFFTTLRKNPDGDNPKQIWHIIAIPSEVQKPTKVRGHINRKSMRNAVASGVIQDTDKDYLTGRKIYKQVDDGYYYTHNPASDTEIRTQVDVIWKKLLKKPLVKMAHEKIDGLYYDFWFYHYRMEKDPDHFNTETGYLIPSTKKIKKRGTVYGIVLDDQKKCIGTTELLVQ